MINKDEMLLVVDANNNPIEPKPRHEVHANGYWHRVSHVWIIDSNKQILCQKRSLLKDMAPGAWEAFFGGHISPGLGYLECAKLEINEELGLNLDEENLKFWKVYKKENAYEFQGVFIFKWNGKSEELIFEKEEIAEIKWVSFNEVSGFVLSSKENNWTKMGYEKELFEYMQKNYQ